MYAPAYGPQPIPGMKIKPPAHTPVAGAVVTGYEICQPDVGCCKCDTLSPIGLLWVVGLTLFTAPLCFLPPVYFIPCCMDSCHEPCQRPIYGQAQSNVQMPQQGQYPQGGQYNQQSQYPPPGQYRDEPVQGVPTTKQF